MDVLALFLDRVPSFGLFLMLLLCGSDPGEAFTSSSSTRILFVKHSADLRIQLFLVAEIMNKPLK